MNLEIFSSGEPLRLRGAVLEALDYRKPTATYSYIGRSEYSSRFLFKAALYASPREIYSSWEIRRARRENVHLLEGHAAPDHNAIARFRGRRLPDAMEDLVYQMVQLLAAHEELSFEESAVFIDGTKIETNANRYRLYGRKRSAGAGKSRVKDPAGAASPAGSGWVSNAL